MQTDEANINLEYHALRLQFKSAVEDMRETLLEAANINDLAALARLQRKLENPQIAHILNQHKVDILNARNFVGDTALIIAVEKRHIDFAKQLLTMKGVNTGIKDTDGYTAHRIATEAECWELVELIEDYEKRKIPAYKEAISTLLNFENPENTPL